MPADNTATAPSPEALVSYSYISTACRPLTDQELMGLLEASRIWNAKHSITGVLIYNEGSFMQLLEGPRDSVHHTMAARIRPASLHQGLIELFELPLRERTFPQWSMACRRLKGAKLPDVLRADDARACHDSLLRFWALWD